MHDASGLELSLLEGMDEDLLARLHGAGVRTRRALGERTADESDRLRLARAINVPETRLAALYYLNFVPPEERAAQALALERRLDEGLARAAADVARLRRAVLAVTFGAAAVLVLALAATFAARRPGAGGAPADSLAVRVARLEAQTARLRPLALAQTESVLLDALGRLGPAAGWSGPLSWSLANDEDLAALAGSDDVSLRARAASILLARLALIENAPLDSLPPIARAREAAELAASFAPPAGLTGVWDAAAVLLRQRLRARAMGLAPPEAEAPPGLAALAWPWTAPGFLAAEELLGRAESLPVRENALAVWSETLIELRRAADLGRDARRDRPEAFARDLWIRRGELELAVTAAALGRANLLPYHGASPEAFLGERRGYVASALSRAPAEARAPLAWLLAEFDEAERLLEWMRANPGRLADAQGKRWIQAMEALEAARAADGMTADPGLTACVRDALIASGAPAANGVWSAGRTRWEAGLRPLLMVTRAEARRPRADSPRVR